MKSRQLGLAGPAGTFFTALVSLNVGCIIASNLLAIKLTTFCGVAVDCGILLYPANYIIGDLIIGFFGKQLANRAVVIAGILNCLVSLLLVAAVHLPVYPGWDGQSAFSTVFGFMPRVVIGSTLAFILAGIVNNGVFMRISRRAGPGHYAQCYLGSSAVAHFIDSAVFETIAFLGVLPLADFIRQAVFAYIAATGLECILFTFLTKPIIHLVEKHLGIPSIS